MNTVLITGATGFVGKNLVKYLASNQFIVKETSIRFSNDISIPKVNTIIHLSGKAHDLKNAASATDYYESNFELTKLLYDAFLKSDAEKFIFLSSVKAVADFTEDILVEDREPDPQTHYGKSKLLAEEYIQNQAIPENKSYIILRPCMIHGPYNKGNLNLLYQFVKKGLPYPLGAFDNRRSFLSIDNLCFIIKNIINKSIESGIYNVSDNDSISSNELISIIANSLKKREIIIKIPEKIIFSIAKVGDFLGLPLNSDKLLKLTSNYQVSNKKIVLAINQSLPLSSREGLVKTLISFKQ
jgi:nucleoside-diphosphate-sugar epimerase